MYEKHAHMQVYVCLACDYQGICGYRSSEYILNITFRHVMLQNKLILPSLVFSRGIWVLAT